MLLNNLETAIVDQTRSFEAMLVQLCQKLGFDHACYAHLNTTLDIISGFTTCPPPLLKDYVSRKLYDNDPILKKGLDFTRPVDWAVFREDSQYQAFFGFLKGNGLGKNGLTVPMKVSRFETGLLSVTRNCSEGAWKNTVRKTLPLLRKEAKHVHSMALTLSPMKRPA